jgi:hypothetical protein
VYSPKFDRKLRCNLCWSGESATLDGKALEIQMSVLEPYFAQKDKLTLSARNLCDEKNFSTYTLSGK